MLLPPLRSVRCLSMLKNARVPHATVVNLERPIKRELLQSSAAEYPQYSLVITRTPSVSQVSVRLKCRSVSVACFDVFSELQDVVDEGGDAFRENWVVADVGKYLEIGRDVGYYSRREKRSYRAKALHVSRAFFRSTFFKLAFKS